MSFPKYPSYKDSGVEWLGEVPEHWVVKAIRLAAKLESGHTPSRSRPEYWENCTVPWITLADVWQIRDGKSDYIVETKEKVSELGLANSSARLLPKDTVVLSRTASVGYSAIMGAEMATTQDFANWICGSGLLPRFLLSVFRGMRGEFNRMMMGSTHNTIYMPDIQALRFAEPPLPEQRAIPAFLDCETAKIDALVAEQRRLIELLQEKRQAVISHAVTKGLNPAAPMKPSGIDWLGDVPEHWDVKKLWYLLAEAPKNGISPQVTNDGSTPTFSIAAVRNGVVDIHRHLKFADIALTDSVPYFVKAGDLLVLRGSGSKDLVGTAGLVIDEPPENCIYPDILIRIRPNELITPWYLVACLNSTSIRPQVINSAQTAAGIWKVSGSSLREVRLPCPPMHEQTQIEAFTRDEVAGFEAMTSQAEHAMDLLQERRTALISAAVTGKIDVRGLADGEAA